MSTADRTTDEGMLAHLATVNDETWEELARRISAVDEHNPGGWGGGEQIDTNKDGFPVIMMPYYEYSEALDQLVTSLYEFEIMSTFDWTIWTERTRWGQSETPIAERPVLDLVKYITAVVRCDRFSEGLLGRSIREGRFLQSLQALVTHYHPTAFAQLGDR